MNCWKETLEDPVGGASVPEITILGASSLCDIKQKGYTHTHTYILTWGEAVRIHFKEDSESGFSPGLLHVLSVLFFCPHWFFFYCDDITEKKHIFLNPEQIHWNLTGLKAHKSLILKLKVFFYFEWPLGDRLKRKTSTQCLSRVLGSFSASYHWLSKYPGGWTLIFPHWDFWTNKPVQKLPNLLTVGLTGYDIY